MFDFLKKHPFAVDAYFDHSIVLTYAIPVEILQPLIPACLQLDTFNNRWGFVAVAMVKTRQLRPAGFPKVLGSEFFLIGYRIFVNYHTREGKRLRGLYILKSETNSKKMERLGNTFTRYQYTTIDIEANTSVTGAIIFSKNSFINVIVGFPEHNVNLPETSPFVDWKQARRFAGPLPFTFSFNGNTREVLIVEGSRENWQPTPVKVIMADIGFLNELKLEGMRLASAFVTKDIPYHWKKGRTELWHG